MPAPQIIVPRGAVPVDPRTHQPAPPPPRDYGKASWGDVLKHGVSTFNAAGARDAGQFGSGILHNAKQIVGAEPSAPGAGRILNSVGQLMLGRPPIGAEKGKGAVYTGPTMADFQKAPGDIAQGFGNVANYVGSYFNQEGLKRHVATDMPGVALDASMLAAGTEGGEGFLAARAAAIENAARAARLGAAVPVMRGVGRVARMAGKADPVKIAAKVAGAGVGAGARVFRGAQAGLDASLPFTPSVANLIKRNFPKLTDADLARPDFRKAMVTSFKQNGINDAAARHGMLQFHGPDMPTPRGPITQKAPPGSGRKGAGPSPAQQATTDAIATGKQQLADKGNELAGASSADPAALGAAVRNTEEQSAANTRALYGKADTQPGGVISGDGDSNFHDRLRINMADGLANAKFSPAAMGTLSKLAATNKMAGDLLDATRRFASAGSISFPDLELLRREIGGEGVNGTAAKAIRGAWDKTVQDHLDAGHATPDTLPDAASNYSDARDAYADHQATYGDDADPMIAKAVGVRDPVTGASFPNADDVQAGNGLHKKLFKGGNKLEMHPDAMSAYNSIEAQGPEAKAALDDHIRQTVLGSDNGHLADRPLQVADFLDTPLGQKAFSTGDASDVRMLTSASDVLKPVYPLGQQGPGLWGTALSAARHGLGAGAGLVAAGLVPGAKALEPGLSYGLGVAGGFAEDRLVEPWLAGRDVARQARGAPALINPAAVAQGAESAAGAGGRGAAVLHGLSQANPPPPPGPPTEAVQGQAPPDIADWDPNTAPSSAAAAAPSPIIVPKGAAPVSSAPAAGAGPQPDYAPPPQPDWDPNASPPKEERAAHAAGGLVVDMTEKLLKRAEQAQKAAQSSTKPLLGLSDDTVAQALRVAQRGL